MKLMHLLLIILLLILGILIKQTWFDEESGRKKLDALQASLEQLQQQNQELLNQNNHIRQVINGIKYNYGAREELARKHLGLIKEDETFFHIIPSENGSNYQESED